MKFAEIMEWQKRCQEELEKFSKTTLALVLASMFANRLLSYGRTEGDGPEEYLNEVKEAVATWAPIARDINRGRRTYRLLARIKAGEPIPAKRGKRRRRSPR